MTNLLAQYAFATPTTTTPLTLVAATGGSRIVVSQVCVIASGATTVVFSGTVAGSISATFPLAANGGFVLPYSDLGWMQTAIGDALIVTLGTGVSTAVQLVY